MPEFDFAGITNLNILIIGDLMLDHYIYGACNRISPEAPVLIVDVKRDEFTLGGAGNVVKNLKAFGCNTHIVCIAGEDDNAKILISKLSENNVSANGVMCDPSRCTTVKTRVLATNHQLIRLDREVNRPISAEMEEKLLGMIESIISSYHLVLVSDYDKGLLTPKLLNGIFSLCRGLNIKTIVDPKGLNFTKYKGAGMIKPNKKEAIAATGIAITDNESLKAACIKIQEQTGCADVVITMSEEGIALYSENQLSIIPTKALDVVDVTGAGDTVLASLGLALALGHTLRDACDFANHAAAIVVSKVGSAVATLDEIKQAMG